MYRTSPVARWVMTMAAIAAAVSAAAGSLTPQTVPAATLALTTILGWEPGVTRDVPLSAPFTIFFNRTMDLPSSEGAWHMSPAVPGRFASNQNSITFTPSHPLRAGSYYRLTVDRSARSVEGIPLASPLSLALSTGDGLKVQSYSPWNGTTGVPSNGLIAITFNHPMVALAGLSAGSQNPPGWRVSIVPRTTGYGSWLGTSTWVFHPVGGLQPSRRYQVTLGRGARDAWGEPLGRDLRWSFHTVTPEIYSRSPRNGTQFADPNGDVTVTFNQPMDPVSTAVAFSVRVSGVVVPGSIRWTRSGTRLVFHPRSPLDAGKVYAVAIGPGARSANRAAALGKQIRWKFFPAPLPRIDSTDPRQGGTAYDSGGFFPFGLPRPPGDTYGATLSFSTPMDKQSLDHHLTISPAVSRFDTWLSGPDQSSQFPFSVYGDFKPSTHYTITIRSGVRDQFGRVLSTPYSLHFKTARLRPSVALYGMPGAGQSISFSAGRVFDAPVQLVNVPKVEYTLVRTSIAALSNGCCSDTQPAGKIIRTWSEQPPMHLNKVQNLGVRLARKDGSPLAPGLYWLGASTSYPIPGLPPGAIAPSSSELIVVTNVSLTVKTANNGTLVWVNSAQTGKPLSGAQVTLVDYRGKAVTSGRTGANGIRFFGGWSSNRQIDAAMIDGRGLFGLANVYWTPGTAPGQPLEFFGSQPTANSNGTYLYTDRPVYRPGQRVYFRGVLWQDRDAVYSLLGPRNAIVQAVDGNGHLVYRRQVTLDRFGAVHGSFPLPRASSTGPSTLYVNILGSIGVSAGFTIAEYRKPEFLTTVTASRGSYIQGQTLTATVDVLYVFGAPVANQHVSWTAYTQSLYAQPPGWDPYSFFDSETPSASVYSDQTQSQFGIQMASGEGTTDQQGKMKITLPVKLARDLLNRTLTVEATTTDVNHQSVSGRIQVPEYSSALAIGVSAQHEVLPAGQQMQVDVVAVRHDGKPLPQQSLTAKIFKRTYTSRLVDNGSGQSSWEAVPHDTLLDTQPLTTDASGKAAVLFTPQDGGEYRVTVSGRDGAGNTARTALSVYASAAGFSDWGLSNNTAIALKPDKASYSVGDTAHILVAAPFDHATALITLERGTIRKYWVRQLETNSSTVDVPITLTDLPNVYVTVTLYHGRRGETAPDWRYGSTQLRVRINPKHLVVRLSQTGYRHHPGDRVTYTVTTTDTSGHPVSAQLSLALVDTAVLALQNENNPDILKALYADRSLDASTASDGVISVDHLQTGPEFAIRPQGGRNDVAASLPAPAPIVHAGGGPVAGARPAVTVRSRFADTAYWVGSLTTDSSGHGVLRLRLPDNATTWRLDARGVTVDQRVGQARLRTLCTKDLLLRPVTPRFLVKGDTFQAGTIVNNNLSRPIQTQVSIAASGLTIGLNRRRTIRIPAHGERLLLWQIRVPAGGSGDTTATLTFQAVPAGAVQGDAVRLQLPVHPPLTDETVATAGQVYAGIRQLVIVPRHAVPQPGTLLIQISSSLTAGLGAAYGQFKPVPYESNGDVADRVLAAAALRSLPESITGLSPAIYRQLLPVLLAGAQKLVQHQYPDGGWPWFNDPTELSDPRITADVVQALSAAVRYPLGRNQLIRQAISRGRNYLQSQLDAVPASDRAHLLLVLAQTGPVPRRAAKRLYRDSIRRLHLDAGALADLGMALELGHDAGKARTVVSALDSRAVVSATGAHWETTAWDYGNAPAVATTTDVLATLVSLSPHDPFVPAAVRWLMFAREGSGWDCSHDSAQAIAALAVYARAAREGTADYQYRVKVDGTVKLAGRYTPSARPHVATVQVPVSRLHRTAPTSLLIGRQQQNGTFGPGPLYYVTRLHYYLPATAIAPRSEGISVKRRYLNLRGQPIWATAAGSAVTVELTIHTDQTLLYLNVQDPIPVGFEPLDQSLATSQQGLSTPPPSVLGNTGDLSWYLQHSDLRDDHVSLYADYLPPGTYRYTYLAQATVPGRYGVPPTHVSETFFPEVFGRSAGQLFTVK